MRKISLILIVAVFVSMMTFGTAYAANYGWTAETLTIGSSDSLVLRGSKNVSLYYSNYIDAVTNKATGYVCATSHSAGDRTVASGSLDQKLYYKDGLNVTPPNAPNPGTATDSGFSGAGWNAL